jgi:hypothetical protein
MNCAEAGELVADHLADSLTGLARSEFASHLAECAACRDHVASLRPFWRGLAGLPAVEPSARLDARFHAMLDGYREAQTPAKKPAAARSTLFDWTRGPWLRQLAAAAVVFIAGLVMGTSNRFLSASNEANPEVARLRDESARLRQIVTLSLLQEPSASDRLRGVDWSSQLQHPGRDVLSALLRALASDPNTNVRLAAVDALRQFAANRAVRDGLIESLDAQPSPMVQIEVIDLLVELGEKHSIPALKKLAGDAAANPEVRLRAERGLLTLG